MIVNADTIKIIAETVQHISEVFDSETIKSVTDLMHYKGALDIGQVTFILLNYLHMSKPQMYDIYPYDKQSINYFIKKAIECNVLPKKGKNRRAEFQIRESEIEHFIGLNKSTMSLGNMAKALGVSKSFVKTKVDDINKEEII